MFRNFSETDNYKDKEQKVHWQVNLVYSINHAREIFIAGILSQSSLISFSSVPSDSKDATRHYYRWPDGEPTIQRYGINTAGQTQ